MKTPMTVPGFEAVKIELAQLKSKDRPSIIAQIAEAREHGDLSENAEYHAAKERQGFIEARIAELEGKMATAQVIDVTTLSGDRIMFGATVTILHVDTDEEVTWKIVGDDESDLQAEKIGISSPIARALIGKEVGDEVVIRTPGGKKETEVMSVHYV